MYAWILDHGFCLGESLLPEARKGLFSVDINKTSCCNFCFLLIGVPVLVYQLSMQTFSFQLRYNRSNKHYDRSNFYIYLYTY